MAVLFVVFLGYQVFGPRGYMVLREREREKIALEEEIRKLKLENLRLSRQVKALGSDPQAIERIAREEMKLARPGDVIYLLPNSQDRPQAKR